MNSAPTVMFVDETASLRDFDLLVTTPAEKRGYGLKCWFFYQSFSQAERPGLPPGVIRGNADVVTYFGGTGDKLTAEEMARYSGKRTIPVPGISTQFGAKMGGSNSSSLHGRDNYMPDEVMNLPLPNMLIQFMGLGMAEGWRIDPSLDVFQDYQAFMRVIEAGGSAQQAASAATAVSAGVAQQQSHTPPPAPKRQPRKPINLNPFSLADKALRKLMGHEDE